MRDLGSRWALKAALLLALAGVLVPIVAKHWQARELLLGLSRPDPQAADEQKAPTLVTPALVVREVRVPTEQRAIPARIYARADALQGPRVVVAHGVHHLGIDEPRLVRFARELAGTGVVVFTPELEDLARYRITERSVSELIDATRYFSSLASGDASRVGLIGFSFGGGLSLLASADSELSEHLKFVASIGGHHDLSRVLRFFMDDAIETPSGVVQQPAHEYGLIVLVYECLQQLLPEEDVRLASEVLEAWLMEDRDLARSLMAQAMSAEAEQLFLLLQDQSLDSLKPELSEVLRGREQHLARLSPRGHLSELNVPAYLLHGSADTVIPPSETMWADLELGERKHLALVSPLVQHVEVSGDPDWIEQWRLLDFMARLL